MTGFACIHHTGARLAAAGRADLLALVRPPLAGGVLARRGVRGLDVADPERGATRFRPGPAVVGARLAAALPARERFLGDGRVTGDPPGREDFNLSGCRTPNGYVPVTVSGSRAGPLATVAAMFSDWKRKRAAQRVTAGDGHELKRYRWWQPFSRALFHLRLVEGDGVQHLWSVDVKLWGDSDGEVVAGLYRDGRHVAQSKLPALFQAPGGTIEVVASGYGLKRCHFVSAEGREQQLVPDPGSAEGRRARLQRDRPGLSRFLGIASVSILVVALVLGVPQIAEQLTSIPPIADRVGTFSSPIHLPSWLNISLVVASLVASTERALRLRYNWVLDGGLFDGDD
ncbi:hypothetical protein [Pseudoclavibacter sp. JSM 162008]|uniref:hypothetical protein n=1 Tax=Pseudoclavibacter sp. JSM 162008 TaxID=3229855 RepID=UPI00352698A5